MGFLDKVLSRLESTDGNENINKIINERFAELIRNLSGADVKRSKKVIDNVVVFTGAAGGVGVSTLVSNVAYMINKKYGLSVLVIDLNIMYPTQHTFWGIQQTLEKHDLISYLFGKNSLGESIDTTHEVALLYANNRTLMDLINAESDAVISNFNVAIDKLRGLFDLIIIDTPMRIENTLINTALYTADHIYLVWDEGISSIANTERIRRNMAFSGIDSHKISVILNKRTNIYYSKYPFNKLGLELIQILPFDTAIIESSLKAQIFCAKGASPNTTAQEFYNGILSLSDKILEIGGYIKYGSEETIGTSDTERGESK